MTAELIAFGLVFASGLLLGWLTSPIRKRHRHNAAGDLPTRLNASLADEGEKEMDLNVTLHLGQSKSIVLNPTGPDGASVPLASVPTYQSSDPSILDVEPAADGLSAKLTLKAVGSATVAIHAEGDATAGVDALDQNVIVDLQQEEANALNAKVVDTPAV